MRAAIEVVRPAADAKQVTIDPRIDDGIGPMRADPGRLQQIAWNLLANAVKFTPKGGRVEVLLSLGADSLRLRVIDSGEGIDPDFLPHVFERFRQADGSGTRSQGGLGLGLAIAKHLVELHDGTVTAHSAGIGRGATFTVTLPIPPAAEGDSRGSWVPNRPTPLYPMLDGVRVLVVDDEPEVLEMIVLILRGRRAIVGVATSAAEALRAAELEPPDVLVADIRLSCQDGCSLPQKLRALASSDRSALGGEPPSLRRQVPALALTGSLQPGAQVSVSKRVTALPPEQDARAAERAGFQRHLAKPFMPPRLVDEVWQLYEATAGRFTS